MCYVTTGNHRSATEKQFAVLAVWHHQVPDGFDILTALIVVGRLVFGESPFNFTQSIFILKLPLHRGQIVLFWSYGDLLTN